jgi:RNA polymerase primary sigma factor
MLLQSAEPAADRTLMNESLSIEISDRMRSLDEKERDVLELFFGLRNRQAHSLEEIGEKYQLTRERVRQIKDRALGRLRENTRTNALKNYLG